MIKSMTGFGKGELKGKLGTFIVEIRTVNHRYFDVSSRIPNSLVTLEDRIKNYIHRYVKRGRVNISLLHRESKKDTSLIKLDEGAIERYYKMLARIKRRFKLADDITLSNILSFPDVLIQEQLEHEPNLVWPLIERAVKKALLDCNRMREIEGKAIYKDLAQRIDKISICIDKISRMAPSVVSEYKNKLDCRIRDILRESDCGIDRKRLETELAIFARGCDVSEEITRARSHLLALKGTLSSTKEAGRRLDFILQELQREINTLGSKAGGVRISRIVVDIKSETEKMREQAQNVE